MSEPHASHGGVDYDVCMEVEMSDAQMYRESLALEAALEWWLETGENMDYEYTLDTYTTDDDLENGVTGKMVLDRIREDRLEWRTLHHG